MNTTDDNSWLDEILNAESYYIDDDGFTEAVVQKLPPKKNRRRRTHWLILSSAALIPVSGIVAATPNLTLLQNQLPEFLFSQSSIVLGLTSMLTCIASGLFAVWLLNIDR